jgi:hypothetical protein
VLLTFRSPYYPLSVAKEYSALGGGPPRFMRASTRLALLEKSSRREASSAYGAITRFGPTFQKVRLPASFVTPLGLQRPHEALTTPSAQRLWPYMRKVWARALSLAATHAVDALFLLLRVLRCVSSPRSLPVPIDSARDVGALPPTGCPIRKSRGPRLVSSSPELFAATPRPSSLLGA